MKINVYVDDCRQLPDGWDVLFRSYELAIPYIKENWLAIERISFDHDMGINLNTGSYQINGHEAIKDLLEWFHSEEQEEWVSSNNYYTPRIFCHSGNPAGKENILAVARAFFDRR